MTVYAIRRRGDTSGPIKIGLSVDFQKRLKSLETSTPEGFEIVALIEGGRGVERSLHRDLAQYRIAGEWFAPAIEVLAAIESAKAGGYDHEDNHARPRAIVDEPTVELETPIVDETRFYLNELIKREFQGAGDTISLARDRVMEAAELSSKYGWRLWYRSQELNDVPGQVYRNLRIAYALTVEREGTINEMQAKFLASFRRDGALPPAHSSNRQVVASTATPAPRAPQHEVR